MRKAVRSAALVATAVLALAGSVTPAMASDDKSYRAGIGLLNKGMHDLAAVELRKFLKDNPDSPDVPMARYALGVCLSRLGDYEKAAAELDAVLRIKDFSYRADAMLLRAQAASETGDADRSIQILREMIKELPGSSHEATARVMLGQQLSAIGRSAEAVAVLRDAVAKTSGEERDRAALLLGLALAATDELEPAAEVLGELSQRETAEGIRGAALLGEARCRQRLDQLDRALELYAQSEKLAGTSAEAGLGRAQVLRLLGRGADAAAALGKIDPAKLEEPLRSIWLLEQGRVLLDQSNVEGAKAAFSKLGEAGGGEFADDAAYWLAKCELRAGKLEVAARAMRDAAEKYEGSPLVAEMLFDEASARTRAGDPAAADLWKSWRAGFVGHGLEAEAVAAQAGCLSRAERYDECLALCDEFAGTWPKHARAESMKLLAAECSFAAEKYPQAERLFANLAGTASTPDVKSRAAVRHGLCLVRMGKQVEGVRELESALSDDSGVPGDLRHQAIAVLGEQATAVQDWVNASRWYEKLARAAKGTPGEADAWLRVGLSLQHQKMSDEAMEAFEQVIALDPDSSIGQHARFERAQLLVDAGKDRAATAEFETVLRAEAAMEEKPLTPHALRHLAAIAGRAGDPQRAAQLLGQVGNEGGSRVGLDRAGALLAAGEYASAEQAYAEWLKTNASDAGAAEARAMRAVAINRLGRHEEAAKELATVDPKGLDARTAASVLYERGLALRSIGRGEDAIAAYRLLLEASPESGLAPFAALDAAQLAIEAQQYDEAVQLLDHCQTALASLGQAEAGKIAPRERFSRAVCLVSLGKASQAVEVLASFEKDFAGDPLVGRSMSLLGDALLRSGRAKDASTALRRSIELDSSPESAGPAMLRLGDAYTALQQWNKADEAFTRYLDLNSDSPVWFQARFGQGWARENQGRHDAAIEAYRDVVARHEGATAARAQFQIGECLFAQKKHEEAVAELIKVDVLYSYPEWSAAALYEAGRCLAELNRNVDAAKQFSEVVDRFPDSSWAALAREKREAARPAPIPGKSREVSTAR